MMTACRLLIGVVASALILSACREMPIQPELLPTRSIHEELFPVRRGTVEKSIHLTGYVVPTEVRQSYFTARDGVLKHIHVVPGEQVRRGQLLAELDTTALDFDYRQAINRMRRVDLVYSYMQSAGSSSKELGLYNIDRQIARTELRKIENLLNGSRLTAPIDGLVVYRLPVYLGEWVRAYQVVMLIAPHLPPSIICNDQQHNHLSIGDRVTITHGEAELQGEVTRRINPLSKGSFYTIDDGVFIRPITDGEISIGDEVLIKKVLERSEETLYIDRAALNGFRGDEFVYLRDPDSGAIREQPVTVGIRNDTVAEIVDGLTDTAVVVRQ